MPPISDVSLTDCEYLVHADPRLVVPLLAQAAGAEARLAAAVYRTSLHEHRGASPGVRRQLLSLDAVRWGSPDLAERFAAVPVADEPEPLWKVTSATGAGPDAPLLFQFAGAEQGRTAAVIESNGRPVAVHGGIDGVRMWDMTSGEPIAGGLVRDVVAVTETDGRLLALTEIFEDEDDPRRLQVWDLTRGEPVCEPFTGPADYLAAAELTVCDGHPVVVTFTRSEPVTVWDPAIGQRISLFDPEDNNVAVACATVDGRPVVATAMVGTVRVWSRAGGAWTCDVTIDHPDWLSAVTISELGGRPVVVTGAGVTVPGDDSRFDHQVRMWDLATGEPIGRPLSSGHDGYIGDLRCMVSAGRTVAVTGAETDSTVRVWDLTSGRQIGRTLTGHRTPNAVTGIGEVDGRLFAVSGDNRDQVCLWDVTPSAGIEPDRGTRVHAMACAESNGRSVALLACMDRTVRIWDVADGAPVDRPSTGAIDVWAITELNGRPVAVTGNWDDGLSVRDLLSGEAIGRPFAVQESLSIQAVACTMLDGRPIALITGESGAAVRRWDLSSGEPIQPLSTGSEPAEPWGAEPMLAVACTELDGRPVAVAGGQSAEVWVWDLASGEPIGKPMAGHLKWSWEAVGKPNLGTKLYIGALTCTRLDGRPIAVTGGEDGTVRRWDLATGREIGGPRIAGPLSDGKKEAIVSVACGDLDGRAIVVSGAQDRTVRVRDLATGDQLGPELTFPDAISQVAATTGGELVIRYGSEIAILKPRLSSR
ncbi:hypothetical protein GCM10010191_61940 [Actinomadura vinacea]|uniref:WD40 repeat domain-containing protein n=1 Tax=Actinomadura vinacea TaxID=115336 RepID=A0ABN3JRM9_9ACTN